MEFILPSGLPEGMTLDAAGQLGGTPTEWGSFEPIFVVTDDLARADQRTIPLVIHDVVTPTGDYEPDGDVDLADCAAFQRCFGQAASALLVRALVEAGVRPVLAVDADPNSCLAEALGVERGPVLADSTDGTIDLDDFAVFDGEMTGP